MGPAAGAADVVAGAVGALGRRALCPLSSEGVRRVGGKSSKVGAGKSGRRRTFGGERRGGNSLA